MLKVIEERRACRKFSDRPVEKEKIEEIVKAGLLAPSGMNRQTPVIIAMSDKKTRDALMEINRTIDPNFIRPGDPFYGAPAMLIVLGQKDWPTHVYDGSLVMGNMMLAAHSLGLGSIWIHRAKEEFETDEYKSILEKLGPASAIAAATLMAEVVFPIPPF